MIYMEEALTTGNRGSFSITRKGGLTKMFPYLHRLVVPP